jgi:hypothetical protein
MEQKITLTLSQLQGLLELVNAGIVSVNADALAQPSKKVASTSTSDTANKKASKKASKKHNTSTPTPTSTSQAPTSDEKVGAKKNYRFGIKVPLMDYLRAFAYELRVKTLIFKVDDDFIKVIDDKDALSKLYQAHKHDIARLNALDVYEIIHRNRAICEPVSKENYKAVVGCDWNPRS